jgi:hypothetical protein
MAGGEESISAAWQSVLDNLETDDRITPQLHGFLSLVEPKGIMAGTFYLEVPNEFTRGMIEQRSRVPLLNAIGSLDQALEVNTFAIVVNPEIQQESMVGPPSRSRRRIWTPSRRWWRRRPRSPRPRATATPASTRSTASTTSSSANPTGSRTLRRSPSRRRGQGV